MSHTLPRQQRRQLLDAVCTAFETSEYALACGTRKTAGTARARGALYALTKATAGCSSVSIARWVGCHHASVLHAIERHHQRMAVADGEAGLPVRIWWRKKANAQLPVDVRDKGICTEYAARYRLAEVLAGVA